MAGRLITFYGINNIGKSTHAKKLVANLRKNGYKAEYIKYPAYDLEPTGPFINHVLRGGERQRISEEELQMWYVLNRYQFQPKLKNWLDDDVIVVAEDYSGTGVAWGTAKGASMNWLIEMNKYLVVEDLAIYMFGKRSMHSKEAVHVHEQNDDLVEKCQAVHEELSKKFGWSPVEVQPSIDDTEKLIWELVNKFLVDRS